MGNTLIAGNPNVIDTTSMAGMIEAEIEKLITLPPDDNPNLRYPILVAIAAGVINHLQANPGAFQITGTDSTGGAITASLTTISGQTP